MPSPFPGMDPFIERHVWGDFHTEMMTAIRAALIPQVRPRYIVRIEEHVYLEHTQEPGTSEAGGGGLILPDVSIAERARETIPEHGGVATATAVGVQSVVLSLPMPQRQREVFLTIRYPETMEVVTAIEVLSPTNKRPGSDGRQEYLRKREAVLLSGAHLIELDLLRGGQRLPTVEPLPEADYYAFLCPAPTRPHAQVFYWDLRDPLPVIPVPLADNDVDAALDLPAIFAAAYDRAGYDYSLDYRAPVEPPLSEQEAAWVREVVEAASPVAQGEHP